MDTNTNPGATATAPTPVAPAVGAINLTKGQNINLTKDNKALTVLGFGMSWDAGGKACDPDASALLLGANGKLIAPDEHAVIFFNHLSGLGVTHSGDNRTGAGDGDDETITVNIANLDATVDSVVLCATIYDEEAIKASQPSKLNFGMTNGLKIRVFDAANPDHTKNTIASFDLTEDYSTNNTLIFGKLYRKDGELKFSAVGEAGTGDLNTLRQKYS